MKKNIWLIIGGIVLLAAVLVGATLLYNSLKDKVSDKNVVEFTQPDSSDAPTVESQDPENVSSDTSDTSENTAAEWAANFTMQDYDGNDVDLSDYLGKPVVLNFWASWCPPCRSEMPDFDEAYKEYGDRINFLIVNLTDGSRETVATAKEFIEEQGFSFPVYFDAYGEGSDSYHLYYIPDTFFIKADGSISGYATGSIDKETLVNQIKMLLD